MAGRKMSAPRLKRLKEALSILASLIKELGGDTFDLIKSEHGQDQHEPPLENSRPESEQTRWPLDLNENNP